MSVEHGMLVVIEGVDGSGKSTAASLLFERLKKAAHPRNDGAIECVLTREPTHGAIGTLFRERLKEHHGPACELSWRENECLLAADRYAHLRAEVLPALREGKVVICDRYVASGFAYALASRPAAVSYTGAHRLLETLYPRDVVPLPRLTLEVQVPPVVSRQRIAKRGADSRYDEDEQLLLAVAAEYRAIARRTHAPGKHAWEVVDGTDVPEVVAARMADAVLRCLRMG